MSNDFYNATGYPTQKQFGASASLRAELTLIQAGFDKLPTLAVNSYKITYINAAGNGMTSFGGDGLLKLSSVGAPTIAIANTDYVLDVGTFTHAATTKTSPVDADEFPMSDSAASFATKKWSWANIKAAVFSAWGALIAGATLKATPIDADQIAIMDSAAANATKATTFSSLATYIWTKWGALISGGTGKTTPVDADSLAMMDSEASNATKTLTLSNLKAYIKTYADTLYQAILVSGTNIKTINGISLLGSGDLAISFAAPPIRQTVLSGPVDSNGFPNFGGSTGSTTVTASGTLKATAAAGGDANYTGSITNPSWAGLSTNGMMYLYLDITSGGVVTTGSTTLAPVYQWGGTYSTTNNQNTFNIQEMTMKSGIGSSASQVYRVFVGEVTVSGGVTTAITWYALMGRYESGWTSTLPGTGTSMSKNHNIGCYDEGGFGKFIVGKLKLKCLTAEFNFSVGDIVIMGATTSTGSGVYQPHQVTATAKAIQAVTSTNVAWALNNKTTGASVTPTAGNWAYGFDAQRSW